MIVVDDVDTILQRLSVAYLDEAAAVATAQLEDFFGRPVELAPVFFHPAKNNWLPDLDPTIHEHVPYYDRWGPFGGLGWLAQDIDETALLHGDEPHLVPDSGRSLCLKLLRATPKLSLCGRGRWSTANGITDTETQLAAFLADNEHDWTSWILDSHSVNLPADTPWQRAQEAANQGDAVALRDALAEAHTRYTSTGHRALTAGVLNVLAKRLADQQTGNP